MTHTNFVSVDLKGGLGNQLFQIFALLSYCITNRVEPALSDSIGGGHRTVVYWDSIFARLRRMLVLPRTPGLMYVEPAFHYTQLPEYNNISKPFTLNGYFQSYKYFESNEAEIMAILDIKHPPRHDGTVSMHFRIGDYAAIQDSHPVMTVDYYMAALTRMVDVTGRSDWTVMYFCEDDDIATVRPMIRRMEHMFSGMRFARADPGEDWEQMMQMSACEHSIIANSTFSWWGARIGDSIVRTNVIGGPGAEPPKRFTLYPERWFGSKMRDKNTDDLFPPEWICIGLD